MKKLITLCLVAVMIATLIPFVTSAKHLSKRTVMLKGKILKVSKHFIVIKPKHANRNGRKFLGKHTVLRVTKNTKILGKGGKKRITDLVKGDYIFVRALTRRISKSLLARLIIVKKDKRGIRKLHKFIGKVLKVNSTGIKIRVTRGNRYSRRFKRKTLTFPIYKETKIRVDDQPAVITDINVGDSVLIISKAPKSAHYFGAYLINKII